MQIEIDLASMTLGEWADIEDATGVAIAGVDLAAPPTKILAGLVWVTRRRAEPAFSYRDALALKMADVRLGRARRAPKARAAAAA